MALVSWYVVLHMLHLAHDSDLWFVLCMLTCFMSCIYFCNICMSWFHGGLMHDGWTMQMTLRLEFEATCAIGQSRINMEGRLGLGLGIGNLGFFLGLGWLSSKLTKVNIWAKFIFFCIFLMEWTFVWLCNEWYWYFEWNVLVIEWMTLYMNIEIWFWYEILTLWTMNMFEIGLKWTWRDLKWTWLKYERNQEMESNLTRIEYDLTMG